MTTFRFSAVIKRWSKINVIEIFNFSIKEMERLQAGGGEIMYD